MAGAWTAQPAAAMITDERNWVSGLHGGGRPIRQARHRAGEVCRTVQHPRRRASHDYHANAPAATGALQMVRAEVSVRDFQRWMGTRRLQDPDHAMHCLLTECFGDLEYPRDGSGPSA